jgi:excisionase family DNA binding protein
MCQEAADPFLTPAEVLARLRVNVKTFYRLIGRGELPAVRIGRQWRVRPHDLETWLRRQQRGTAPLGPEHAGGTPGVALGGEVACHPPE